MILRILLFTFWLFASLVRSADHRPVCMVCAGDIDMTKAAGLGKEHKH